MRSEKFTTHPRESDGQALMGRFFPDTLTSFCWQHHVRQGRDGSPDTGARDTGARDSAGGERQFVCPTGPGNESGAIHADKEERGLTPLRLTRVAGRGYVTVCDGVSGHGSHCFRESKRRIRFSLPVTHGNMEACDQQAANVRPQQSELAFIVSFQSLTRRSGETRTSTPSETAAWSGGRC